MVTLREAGTAEKAWAAALLAVVPAVVGAGAAVWASWLIAQGGVATQAFAAFVPWLALFVTAIPCGVVGLVLAVLSLRSGELRRGVAWAAAVVHSGYVLGVLGVACVWVRLLLSRH